VFFSWAKNYDRINIMIISTDKEKYLLGENIALISPLEIGKEIEQSFAPPLSYVEEIKAKLQEEITEERIIESLSNVGF